MTGKLVTEKETRQMLREDLSRAMEIAMALEQGLNDPEHFNTTEAIKQLQELQNHIKGAWFETVTDDEAQHELWKVATGERLVRIATGIDDGIN